MVMNVDKRCVVSFQYISGYSIFKAKGDNTRHLCIMYYEIIKL